MNARGCVGIGEGTSVASYNARATQHEGRKGLSEELKTLRYVILILRREGSVQGHIAAQGRLKLRKLSSLLAAAGAFEGLLYRLQAIAGDFSLPSPAALARAD